MTTVQSMKDQNGTTMSGSWTLGEVTYSLPNHLYVEPKNGGVVVKFDDGTNVKYLGGSAVSDIRYDREAGASNLTSTSETAQVFTVSTFTDLNLTYQDQIANYGNNDHGHFLTCVTTQEEAVTCLH